MIAGRPAEKAVGRPASAIAAAKSLAFLFALTTLLSEAVPAKQCSERRRRRCRQHRQMAETASITRAGPLRHCRSRDGDILWVQRRSADVIHVVDRSVRTPGGLRLLKIEHILCPSRTKSWPRGSTSAKNTSSTIGSSPDTAPIAGDGAISLVKLLLLSRQHMTCLLFRE